MTAPVKTKTWTHTNVSVAIGSGPPDQSVSGCGLSAWAADVRQLIWEIKNFLVTAPAAWTVVSSCGHNGSNFVADDTDNWGAASNVWSIYLGEYSWIVLKQTSISAVDQGFQILLVVDGAGTGCTPNSIEVWISSSSGFTGGTTSSRPTAADGIKIFDSAFMPIGDTTRGFSGFKSSDGECTRLYTSWGGGNVRLWMFDRAGTPRHADWTVPFLAIVDAIPTYAILHDAANVSTTWDGRGGLGIYLTTEGQGGGALGRWTNRGDIPNYFGEYICTRIGVAAINSIYVSKAAFLGWVSDLWFTSDDLADGDYFPGDSSQQFAVFGDLLQPNESGENIIID